MKIIPFAMAYSYIFCDFIAEMSGNETEEVVGADNQVAFSIEGIALLHVGILGKDFKIVGQEGIIPRRQKEVVADRHLLL